MTRFCIFWCGSRKHGGATELSNLYTEKTGSRRGAESAEKKLEIGGRWSFIKLLKPQMNSDGHRQTKAGRSSEKQEPFNGWNAFFNEICVHLCPSVASAFFIKSNCQTQIDKIKESFFKQVMAAPLGHPWPFFSPRSLRLRARWIRGLVERAGPPKICNIYICIPINAW